MDYHVSTEYEACLRQAAGFLLHHLNSGVHDGTLVMEGISFRRSHILDRVFVAPFAVKVKAGYRAHKSPIIRSADELHCLLQIILVSNDLVVIQSHNDLGADYMCGNQLDVAHVAIPTETDHRFWKSQLIEPFSQYRKIAGGKLGDGKAGSKRL